MKQNRLLKLFFILFLVANQNCFINTEAGKCRRDIEIEKVDEGDPCVIMFIFNSENSEEMSSIAQYVTALCIKQELEKTACGKKSNWLPVLQEIRGDM